MFGGFYKNNILRSSFQFFPFLFVLFLLALLSSCAFKAPITELATKSRFRHPPMRYAGVEKLPESEARLLAHKLSPGYQKLSSWREMEFAVDQSLAHISRRPAANNGIDYANLKVSNGELTKSLEHFKKILPQLDSNPELLVRDFNWYRIGPDFSMTGYFEPTLNASRVKSKKYYYPLYKKPKDLRRGVRYHTRHAIDRKGALDGRGLEIAWVDSEVDAFFLHIQGSGRLLFADGTQCHILYSDKNNRAYKALGREMKERGLLEDGEVSMQNIRRVLDENPHQKHELLDTNMSYVFFREADRGPLGAMGRPLTPWVSSAVDRRVLPFGSLAFTAVGLPDAYGEHHRPLYALVLPQDVGGAIKGNRMDLFFGPGEEAEHLAGHLNSPGAIYVLVKK